MLPQCVRSFRNNLLSYSPFPLSQGKTSYLLPFSTERQNHLTNCFFNVDYLLGVLETRPDSFLDGLQPALAAFARRDGRIDQASLMTVSRMLRREGMTAKALSKIARERSR
jgi:hypothetical protein